jgi:outer membrane lipoprotein-sorting protein
MTSRIPVFVLALVCANAMADARSDVQTALTRIVDDGGFHARVQGHVFGPDVAPVSGEVDVIFPDRAHVRSESLEFIVIGEGAWVSAFDYWAPTSREMLPVTAFDPPAMRKAIAAIRDVKEEGSAKTATCPARVYRFEASGSLPGADAEGEVRLWVCESDRRAARLEAKDRDGQRVVVDFDRSRRPVVTAP